ncbi:MAG: 50S ribosomal protein P1, partial [Candidatus Hodarchaeales archaeon]
EARVQALVATLSEIDIGEAIKTVSTAMVPITPASTNALASAQKKEEEKEEEEEEKEEEALAGLGALFQ